MADISIIKVNDRAMVTGVTFKGMQWLLQNIEFEPDYVPSVVTVSIPSDCAADMEEYLKRAGLEVDSK